MFGLFAATKIWTNNEKDKAVGNDSVCGCFHFFWSYNKREEHEKTIKTAVKKKKMLVIK